MLNNIKIGQFKGKDADEYPEASKCGAEGDVKGTNGKKFKIILIVAEALAVAGLIAFASYYGLTSRFFSRTNNRESVTTSLSMSIMRNQSSEGFKGHKISNVKSTDTKIFDSTVAIDTTEELYLDSQTTNKSTTYKDCPKRCPRIYRPVCGTNNETYSSKCILDVASCKVGDENLTIAYEGECKSRLEVHACCSELELDSTDHIYYLGRYKFDSLINGRPMYKSARMNAYLFWTTQNVWMVAPTFNTTHGIFYHPWCDKSCAEDCLLHDWKTYNNNQWINDNTFGLECFTNSRGNVDACEKTRPLEISYSKTGMISYPINKYQYQNIVECEWKIEVGIGHIIKIDVLKQRLVGLRHDSYIMLLDGKSLSAPIIGQALTGNLTGKQDSIFSTGRDMYIMFRQNAINAKSQFILEYSAEKCNWSEWQIGECSKSCGGGLKPKFRHLLNTDNNARNCGLPSVLEPCNVQSCVNPICKYFGMKLAHLPLARFTLLDSIINNRVVYIDAEEGIYLYFYVLNDENAAWVIGLTPGSEMILAINGDCKDTTAPENGDCNHGWHLSEGNGFISAGPATMECYTYDEDLESDDQNLL